MTWRARGRGDYVYDSGTFRHTYKTEARWQRAVDYTWRRRKVLETVITSTDWGSEGMQVCGSQVSKTRSGAAQWSLEDCIVEPPLEVEAQSVEHYCSRYTEYYEATSARAIFEMGLERAPGYWPTRKTTLPTKESMSRCLNGPARYNYSGLVRYGACDETIAAEYMVTGPNGEDQQLCEVTYERDCTQDEEGNCECSDWREKDGSMSCTEVGPAE